jgi:carbamoylphosphate synthase large subunit
MRSPSPFWESIEGTSATASNDAGILEAAHRVVETYLVFLREHETDNNVFDTAELPAPKEALVNAFRVVIATENRAHTRSLMIKAGLTLAQFQDNIGSPLLVRPTTPARQQGSGRGRIDIANIRKVDRAILRLGEERVRLAHVFQKAARLAEGKLFYHA